MVSLPMPMIMRVTSARGLVHQPAHGRDALGEPDEDRLADQEMADVEFGDLGNARDRLDRVVGEAVAGVNLKAELPCRRRAASAMRAAFALEWRRRRNGTPRNRCRCAARPPARRARRRHRAGARSASMNSETRMPASPSAATIGCRRLCWPAASMPPSVVRSSRRSGTMQAACGRWRSAIDSISSVAAISRLSGRRRSHRAAARCRGRRCGGDLRADAR